MITVASAQMGPPMKPGEVNTSLELVYIYQGDAELESGGEVGIQRFGIEGGATWGLQSGHSIGFDVGYSLADYNFKSEISNPIINPEPWGQIQTVDIDVVYRHSLNRTQYLFFLPGFQFSKEADADWGSSLRWGGIAGYVKAFNPKLALGLGGAYFGGLEDSTGFPVIFVYWEFADNWRLSNPFRPGPSGAAGLEVVYSGIDKWEFGFGGGYRTDRFVLDDNGLAPEGYGENQGAVLFGRGTYNLNEGSTLDLYMGTVVGGQLILDDSNGDRVASEDYDPSLVGAVALTMRF